MRVVVDTNVLISAFLWRKTSWGIFHLASKNIITICISREILDEFSRVLSYPKIAVQLDKIGKTPGTVIDELLAVVEYYEKTPKVSIIKEDPDDNIILACALAAQVDYIISGDKHLLKLNQFYSIPILPPGEFLNLYT